MRPLPTLAQEGRGVLGIRLLGAPLLPLLLSFSSSPSSRSSSSLLPAMAFYNSGFCAFARARKRRGGGGGRRGNQRNLLAFRSVPSSRHAPVISGVPGPYSPRGTRPAPSPGVGPRHPPTPPHSPPGWPPPGAAPRASRRPPARAPARGSGGPGAGLGLPGPAGRAGGRRRGCGARAGRSAGRRDGAARAIGGASASTSGSGSARRRPRLPARDQQVGLSFGSALAAILSRTSERGEWHRGGTAPPAGRKRARLNPSVPGPALAQAAGPTRAA